MWRRVKGEMGLFNDQCVTQSFMSLNKGVARLKFKRRQLPFPPSSSLSSPPLSPLPARGSGGALWAPPLGLGWNPSRWSIWCIFESKRMALVTTLLWTLNQNIFSFLDWVSESWNPRLWRLIAILVNFLVCRKKKQEEAIASLCFILAIYIRHWVWRWKNFENQSIFAKVMGENQVSCFLLTGKLVVDNCSWQT